MSTSAGCVIKCLCSLQVTDSIPAKLHHFQTDGRGLKLNVYTKRKIHYLLATTAAKHFWTLTVKQCCLILSSEEENGDF